MKKKRFVILGIIIAVLCALGLSACDGSLSSSTYVVDDAGVVYEIDRDGVCTVNGVHKRDLVTEVTISPECNGLPVVGIQDSAFRNCQNLVSVEIPDSITSIGYGAFCGCYELASIKIPYGVTAIQYETFRGCRSLTDVEIPDTVTSIGSGAFQYCRGLTDITIPNSVTYIGESAFLECSGLTNIEIPEGVTSIGHEAFRDCSSLMSIELPNSLQSIKSTAFYNDTIIVAIVPSVAIPSLPEESLQTVTVSGGSIGARAFYRFDNLISITISDTVTNIERDAIPSLATLTIYCESEEKPSGWEWDWCGEECSVIWHCKNNDIDSNGYSYSVIDGIRYRLKNGIATVVRQSSGISGEITIPASVTYMDKIYIVTAIEDNAFLSCSDLSGINMPNSLTSIGACAFEDCIDLRNIEIPRGVITIGRGAFQGCSELISVSIPNTVTTIGENAFWSCGALENIEMPNSVTSIGDNAFSGCAALTQIYIPNGVTTIGRWTFSSCTNLTCIIISSSVTKIDDQAFWGCDNFAEVYFIGTAEQLNAIAVGQNNSGFNYAAVYYYSETQPLVPGNYWHYAADWSTPEKW